MKERIKEYLHNLLLIETSPHLIALGFAVGTFINVLPTPGFNIILAALAIFLYPHMNQVAVFASFVIWNPLLTPFLYGVSYAIGDLLFENQAIVTIDVGFWLFVYSLAKRFLIGSFILASIIALLAYTIVYHAAVFYKKKRTN